MNMIELEPLDMTELAPLDTKLAPLLCESLGPITAPPAPHSNHTKTTPKGVLSDAQICVSQPEATES